MAGPIVKLVVLGERTAGVGPLLLNFVADEEELPQNFNPHVTHRRVANVGTVELRIWKLHEGMDWSEQLMVLGNADAVLVVFSLLDQPSYSSVLEHWSRILGQHCASHARVILAGGGRAQRDNSSVVEKLANEGKIVIAQAQGHTLKKRLGASHYIEYDLDDPSSVQKVFNQLIGSAILACEQRSTTSLSSSSSWKTKSKSSGGSKLPSMTEEFIRSCTVEELKKAIAEKQYNWRVVEGTSRSAFSVALFAGNLAVADELLKMNKGTAQLGGCSIKQVPDVLFKWRGSYIRKIDLSNNALIALPAELRHFEKVVLTGNPLLSIPEEIRGLKWKQLRQYLASIADQATALWSVRKVVLIGEEGVGKTTLRRALSGKAQRNTGTANLSTDGVEMTTLRLKRSKEESFDFNVWDFGGQVVYYPTHQFFLSSQALFVLVFSFADLRYQRMEYWMKYIKSMCPEAVLVMVGTHVDMCSPDDITRAKEEIRNRFPKHRFTFFQNRICEVSNPNGRGVQTVKDLLIELAEHESLSPEVAATWIGLHNLLMSKQALGVDRVPWLTYKDWARVVGVTSEEELLLATRVLHNSGSLLYFGNGPQGGLLDDVVILNPQWLADMMSCIITTKANFIRGGVLLKEDIGRVFQDRERFPTELHPTFVELLTRFRVMLPLNTKGKDSFLVPSMLGGARPATALARRFPLACPAGTRTVGRVMTFLQLPLGFMERVLLNLLHCPGIEQEVVWRKGLLVREGTSQLLLEYDSSSYRLYIFFRFSSDDENATRKWRSALNQVLDLLRSFYIHLTRSMDEAALCTHCLRKGVNREKLFCFPIDDCIAAARKGDLVLYCHGIQSVSRCVKLHQLAPDLALVDLPHIPRSAITLEGEVGQGAAGVVYKAIYQGKPVAVKTIKLRETISSKEQFTEFQAEVFIMTFLECPNIVQLYGIIDDPLGMVLQFVDGGDLFTRLHPQEVDKEQAALSPDDLPWPKRLSFARDIAVAMDHLHQVTPPIIHRDLRSPNIFLDGEKALLGDFGLARRSMGEVGGVLGSWQWIAPEALDSTNQAYDERSDLYSMAMVFFELASLEIPFDEYCREGAAFVRDGKVSVIDLKRAIAGEELRPTPPPHCPQFFADLMRGLWCGDPAGRTSASRALSVLNEAMGITPAKSLPLRDRGRVEVEILTKREVENLLEDKTKVKASTEPFLEHKLDIVRSQERAVRAVGAKGNFWVGLRDGQIRVLCAGLKEMEHCVLELASWKAHRGKITAMLAVGDAVWACGLDGFITVWDAMTCTRLEVWKPYGEDSSAVPTSLTLVKSGDKEVVWCTCQMECKITVWDGKSFKFVASVTDDLLLDSICCHQFGLVVWASTAESVAIYDASTLDFLGKFNAHNSRVVAMAEVNGIAWTASYDDVAAWAVGSNPCDISCLSKSKAHIGRVEVLLAVPSSNLIFSSSFDGSFLRWDAKRHKVLDEVAELDNNNIVGMAAPGNDELWTVAANGLVQLWPAAVLEEPCFAPRYAPLKEARRPSSDSTPERPRIGVRPMIGRNRAYAHSSGCLSPPLMRVHSMPADASRSQQD